MYVAVSSGDTAREHRHELAVADGAGAEQESEPIVDVVQRVEFALRRSVPLRVKQRRIGAAVEHNRDDRSLTALDVATELLDPMHCSEPHTRRDRRRTMIIETASALYVALFNRVELF